MSWARVVTALLIGVVVVLAFVVVAAPLVVMSARIVGLPGSPNLDALRALAASQNLLALRSTLIMSAAAAAVSVVVGVPLAVLVERTDVVGSRGLGALAALPLAVPPYLLAFAFRAAWDDRIGLFPLPSFLDVDSLGGVSVVLGVAFLPIVVLRLRATLGALDGALEEAARTAGATPMMALRNHTLVLVRPTVVSSAVLVFVAAAAAYGVPVLLGLAADPPVVVLTARIAVAMQGGHPDAVVEGLGLSVALAGLAGIAFALPALLKGGVAVVTGKASRPVQLRLGAFRAPVSAACWALVGVFVVVPLAALMVQGVILHAGRGLAVDNLGLDHIVEVLGRSEVRGAALTSLWLALGAALLVILIAVIVVVARRRLDGLQEKTLRVVGATMELVYALPGTVVAVALILTFAAELRLIVLERVTFALALGGTTALLLVAYAMKYAALGLRAVDEALDQLHPSLDEAARIAGARPVRAFVDVTLPLLRGHLIAAGIAVALPCFTELTMSVLLQAPGTQTLGVVLFSLYEYGDPQEAMALAGVLVVVAVLGQLGIVALRRR